MEELKKELEETRRKLEVAREGLLTLTNPQTWMDSYGAGGAEFIYSIVKKALKESE